MKLNADLCHEYLLKTIKPLFSFDKNKDFNEQKAKAKKKLTELMGWDLIALNSCKENFTIESEEEKDGYRKIRFVVETEKNMFVPCYLLIPNQGKEKYPVAITLQGHAKGGMLNSLGIEAGEEPGYLPRGAFAIQAVKNGFAALCVELRGMSGELQPQGDRRLSRYAEACGFAARTGLLLGRPIIGERCWDISRVLDSLYRFKQLDLDNIVITGNSGGGTTSYYAACMDERIKVSAPSCSFCTFGESLFYVNHCVCNFIPNILNYFDMQDLAILIAPRKLLVVAGQEDPIFKIDGVKKGFETVKAVYDKCGKPNNCNLIVTPKAHYWCEDVVWGGIAEMQKV